ncbi:MAG TPA: ABC transporter substrate-binding protein [Blastocatellia bacterium]|nr:ABC transporter substrate-binding protein [Blastocatellia bacterium]
MIDRRTIVGAIAAGLVGAPRLIVAQAPPRVYRIGLLGVSTAAGYARQAEAFRRGLSEHGYVEGHNVVIDQRWADGDAARLPGLAAELVRLRPDVIVTSGPATAVAKRATDTIPIVMTAGFDPAATGLVASLARPGGNLPGATIFVEELVAKRVQIVKEALPRVARVGVLLGRGSPEGTTLRQAMDDASRQVGVAVAPFEVRDTAEFGAAFAAMAGGGIGALVVGDHTILVAEAARIAGLANAQRLPSIGFVDFAAAGGLFAYGVDFPDLWHRAAETVDRILKGAKPADMPIQRPTRFEFVVNLRTANTLGLAVPPTLLQRADVVIR